ncbi:hypothetical protein ABEB36_003670 [Hypothenemus hampei]|uniref:Uncharacterized protein n=1 Tax=Hypothenemus hampei TaxID=57062 RepID=A0ABD1F0Q3_HYPHA
MSDPNLIKGVSAPKKAEGVSTSLSVERPSKAPKKHQYAFTAAKDISERRSSLARTPPNTPGVNLLADKVVEPALGAQEVSTDLDEIRSTVNDEVTLGSEDPDLNILDLPLPVTEVHNNDSDGRRVSVQGSTPEIWGTPGQESNVSGSGFKIKPKAIFRIPVGAGSKPKHESVTNIPPIADITSDEDETDSTYETQQRDAKRLRNESVSPRRPKSPKRGKFHEPKGTKKPQTPYAGSPNKRDISDTLDQLCSQSKRLQEIMKTSYRPKGVLKETAENIIRHAKKLEKSDYKQAINSILEENKLLKDIIKKRDAIADNENLSSSYELDDVADTKEKLIAIENYVKKMEIENKDQILKLEKENVTLQNKIKTLEKELRKNQENKNKL